MAPERMLGSMVIKWVISPTYKWGINWDEIAHLILTFYQHFQRDISWPTYQQSRPSEYGDRGLDWSNHWQLGFFFGRLISLKRGRNWYFSTGNHPCQFVPNKIGSQCCLETKKPSRYHGNNDRIQLPTAGNIPRNEGLRLVPTTYKWVITPISWVITVVTPPMY